MKPTLQVSVFTVVAVLCTAMTATASAETMLLEEWLREGVGVTELVATGVSGGVLLEDTETIAGSAAVLCHVTLSGSVGPNGEGEIVEILNAKSEKIGELGSLALLGTGATSGEGSECVSVKTCAAGTAASPIEVWPIGVPWHGELRLMENGEVLGSGASTTGEKVVGYEILCLVLSIDTEDKCTAATVEGPVINNAETGDAGSPTGAEGSPLLTCSQSAKATGRTVADEVWVITVGPVLLTISSE